MTETRTEPATCGVGLAAHAPVPELMGHLSESVADVLEAHMPGLDLADPGARQEHAAYASLVAAHRRIAAALRATSLEMVGYRALPEARHDPHELAGPRAVAAFETFVQVEDELRALLDERLTQDRQMLAAMRQ